MPRMMRTRTFVGRAALACVIGWASRGAHAQGLWPKLWATAPQRAERALEAGHPGEAAKLFKDPRRRAYAELRAGRYAAAARLLKGFADAESEYNRGNALARTGHLRGALAAYDAALAKMPHDGDAIHNRNLVARALAQRAHPGGKGRGRRGHAGRPGQGGSSNRASRGAQGRSGTSSGGRSNGAFARGAMGPGRSGSRGQSARERAEQARQDAELAARLQRQAAKRAGGSRSGGAGTARSGSSGATDLSVRRSPQDGHSGADSPALSEQALALQQWLRRIPDDPGGLLRRKFLIEHLERQQRAQERASGENSTGAQP